MTRTEIITRLCEMSAELTELHEQAEGSDTKFYLNNLGQHFQKTLQKMQGE